MTRHHTTRRSRRVCVTLLLAAVAITGWALVTGAYPVSVREAWGALTGDPGVGFARTVVVDWRLPRALAALLFGAALGLSGAIFQSLTRNPLASPDVIGFTTGCHTGALVTLVLLGGGHVQVAGGALVGGLLTAGAVYLLSWQGGVQGIRLIIVGIAVSAVLGSTNTWLLLRADPDTALTAAVWGAGSVSSITWQQLTLACPVIVALAALAGMLARPLRQLELGDDAAAATGVAVERVRGGATLVGIGLTAAVTAAAGPIVFVALAAPQIGRRLAGSAGMALAPAVCSGALLLATADFVAQHLTPVDLPVGVVTVVVGGAYLVWLLVQEGRRSP